MIPYLLAAVGGYLLGDSMKDSQTFADGGNIGGNIDIDIPRYLYHATPSYNAQKIKENGLSLGFDGRIFLVKNVGAAIDIAKQLHEAYKDEDEKRGIKFYHILRIDTQKIPNSIFYKDSDYNAGIYIEKSIPKEAIKHYESTNVSLDKGGVIIKNPSTDEYNEIYVENEKVGYIVLSPAAKEYYWLDLNLPNPLAIVDIKIFNQFRGKNYMTQTMNWLYDFAKQNEYKSLFLRIDDNSEIDEDTLLKIYQKNGFSIYRNIEEDDIFMYKLL